MHCCPPVLELALSLALPTISGSPQDRIRYFFPTKQITNYIWPGVEVKQITPDNKGLFATARIPKCTAIPYLGKVIDYAQADLKEAFVTSYLDEHEDPRFRYLKQRLNSSERKRKATLIDASGFTTPYRGIGIHGLAVGGMINEPKKQENVNLASVGDYFVTMRDIEKGEQLLACYGGSYTRDYDFNSRCKKPPKLPAGCGKPMSLKDYFKLFPDIQEERVNTRQGIRNWLAL